MRSETDTSLNDMKLRRKWRTVSLYVEWTGEDDSDALVRSLTGDEVRGADIDRDVDVEAGSNHCIGREHTVLRFCVGRGFPVWRLMAAVASYPGVFSVGEI